MLVAELVIGFIDTPYVVNENDGFVTVMFGVRNGTLENGFQVEFSLADGTALGEL